MFYNTTFSHMLNIAMVCIANYLIVRSHGMPASPLT